MKTKHYRFLILFLLLPWLGACSMGQMVARTSVSIMDGNVEAMNRETDLVLAEAAIPANLKLVEGLIAEDPDNPELLYLAAQGFYGYAFGFVERSDPQRAEALYTRGLDYGIRGLRALGLDKDIDLATANPDAIEKAVARMGSGAVPTLFWTASCWAKQIDMRRTDPARIAQLAGTERLMSRVRELQPDYYYGGVYIYYGVYYGSRAPMMGGDFARSEQNFSAARAVSQDRLLIVDVLQAEYLERQRLDRDAFHRLLSRVVTDPVGSFPEMALPNQIARARAHYLLDRESEWF
ncbi:MAG: TRAP transporter TatT component family protein [Thiogranum sp.]